MHLLSALLINFYLDHFKAFLKISTSTIFFYMALRSYELTITPQSYISLILNICFMLAATESNYCRWSF